MKARVYRWLTVSQILALVSLTALFVHSPREWLALGLGWGLGAQLINLYRGPE